MVKYFNSFKIMLISLINEWWKNILKSAYSCDNVICNVERVDCSCNFERGMCGWTVGGPDRYIWQIGKGKTRTSNTGPNRDHTTSTCKYTHIKAKS